MHTTDTCFVRDNNLTFTRFDLKTATDHLRDDRKQYIDTGWSIFFFIKKFFFFFEAAVRNKEKTIQLLCARKREYCDFFFLLILFLFL